MKNTERRVKLISNENEVIEKTPLELKMELELEQKKEQKKLDFAQLQRDIDLLIQNPNKTPSRTFIRRTKDLIKTYLLNPYTNIDAIRETSAFLSRTSMIYRKILSYFAHMPLFYYNVIYQFDITNPIDQNTLLSGYQDILKNLQKVSMEKEFSRVIATALRDGAYFGFVYDSEGEGFFLHGLNPAYCKVSGITNSGEYVIAFDASFFDVGDNDEFIYGINDDGVGVWNQVFIDGYNTYKSQGRDYRFFDLPPESTICVLTEDDAEMPLPYFLPIFTSLLDLLDLEQILMSKTELENYILLISKIPLLTNAESSDEFAVSLEMVQQMNRLIESIAPDLVGVGYSPCDLDVIHFNKANTADDTDKLAQSMNNMFSNLGISELVVSGGSSTNSVGLAQSIMNDESLSLNFVSKLTSWWNSYIRLNYSEDYIFYFHQVTYFSKKDFQDSMKEAATLGVPEKMDYATSLGRTPYEVMCATHMENVLGLTDLWKPLQSAYTQSGDPGAPEKDATELTDEGVKTKDGNKNAGTAASK